MFRVMSATNVRTHLGDVMRQVVSNGEAVIVERDGQPQVAVVSLADFERLQELRTGELRPSNRAALDWLNRWASSPDDVDPTWWKEFERELHEHPLMLGEAA